MRLTMGTRGSALARAQSHGIAEQLRARGHDVDVVLIETSGDGTTTPLAGRGHEGIFVDSLRTALVEGSIDFAVHSYKDVPVERTDADESPTVMAAVPVREDPRDVLISREAGAAGSLGRVGTCSVRRAAWVGRVLPRAVAVPIRGNIDDRIDQCRRGDFDAIVLAAAGLNRLGVSGPVQRLIDSEELVPAPSQGALAIECAVSAVAVRRALAELEDAPTRLAVVAERAVLAAIDPTDGTALGAVATYRHGHLSLLADLSRPDGSERRMLRRSAALAPTDRAGAAAFGLALAAEIAS